jgi:transcriptional regulator with XRE-family HTH domain
MSIVDWNSYSVPAGAPLPNSGEIPVRLPSGSLPNRESAVNEQEECEADSDWQELEPVQIRRDRPLHRLAEVRQQQGVTLRNVARRMRVDLKTVRHQEDNLTDLTLTQLYAWQQVLDVPVADLLVDDAGPLSPAVKQRAQLVRVMKTAVAMLEQCDSSKTKRMAQTLIDQLLDIMPELKEVGAWHTVGQRRTVHEIGRIGSQTVPDDFHRRAQN